MLHQDRLDLDRGDVLAAPANNVLASVDKSEHAPCIAAHQVPGMEPAVAPSLLSRLLVLQVVAEESEAGLGARMAHEQFAALAGRNFRPVFVDHPALEVGARCPDAGGSNMARLAICDQYSTRASLGHTGRPLLASRAT